MIIAGIGCRKGTPAAEIEAAIAAALARAGLDRAAIGMIATSAAKDGEPGIAGAAAALGVPLVLVAHGRSCGGGRAGRDAVGARARARRRAVGRRGGGARGRRARRRG